MDMECNEIMVWENVIQASQELNINKGYIYAACRGEIKYTSGYKWKYQE